MTRRPGISLTEILVALFIMALGVLGILTMFPLGIIEMGHALKDDRATQCAYQADAYMRWYWKSRNDQGLLTGEPFFQAMNNPGTPVAAVPTTDATESYPVLVDPMGTAARGGGSKVWLGDDGQGSLSSPSGNQTSIPRRSLNLIETSNAAVRNTLALRTCSLLDTLGFADNGQPLNGGDMRTLPYNWAWLLQRKDNREQLTAEMKVIVYDKRVHLFQPSASEKVFTPAAAITAGQSVVSFSPAAAPPVLKGGWLMDVSVTNLDTSVTPNVPFVPATTGTPPSPAPGVRNGNLYRVVSVTQNPTTGNVDIELQTVVKALSGNGTGFNYAAHGRFIVLGGIYEVFEMPPLTSTGP